MCAFASNAARKTQVSLNDLERKTKLVKKSIMTILKSSITPNRIRIKLMMACSFFNSNLQDSRRKNFSNT